MKNTQERFGRPNDDGPSLLKQLPILGRRVIRHPEPNMVLPHTLKYHQLIYVHKGDMSIWINGHIYEIHEKELIVIQPYQTMAFLKGAFPKGEHYFAQFDLFEFEESSINESLSVFLRKKFPIVLYAGERFLTPCKALLKEFKETHFYSQEMATHLFEILKINLLRLFDAEFGHHKDLLIDSDFFEKVNLYVDENLDRVVTVKELSELCGFSENHFRNLFKKLTDMSPLHFINTKKLNAAREMLINESMNITDISFALGFSSCQYFSTFFKKQTSMSPIDYRKSAIELCKKSVHKSVLASEAAAQLDSHFKLL
ncbi:MAG: AraC family transcriptional regulator [Lentisphaeraceae bacterium]|nr:AraC family transcriptional regulator [Lentisphaeraceae bacterium]